MQEDHNYMNKIRHLLEKISSNKEWKISQSDLKQLSITLESNIGFELHFYRKKQDQFSLSIIKENDTGKRLIKFEKNHTFEGLISLIEIWMKIC